MNVGGCLDRWVKCSDAVVSEPKKLRSLQCGEMHDKHKHNIVLAGHDKCYEGKREQDRIRLY